MILSLRNEIGFRITASFRFILLTLYMWLNSLFNLKGKWLVHAFFLFYDKLLNCQMYFKPTLELIIKLISMANSIQNQ